MNIDRRFAIIIGINDYSISPLNFCVNDAVSISELLEKKCFFKKEDIYLITSDKQNPSKEISGRFDKSIEEIQKQINYDKDSIFFFFAGHGMYEEENSKLQFHELNIEIKAIFDKINILNPKNQFYVIDACESGGRVFSRKSSTGSLIDKFIHNSSGTYFMFASTENQSAYEKKELGHGMFTNYFLKAIENEKMYDEGVLTPSRIQEYIAKETQKNSNFNQIPVIESRTVGYYPFAFTLDKIEENKRKTEEINLQNHENDIADKKIYFPEIPIDKRKEVFNTLASLPSSYIENLSFNSENYLSATSENLSIFPLNADEELLKKIVSESIKQDVISVEDIFSAERTKINTNQRLGSFSMLNSLFNNTESEYRTEYYINFGDESRILSKSIFLTSKNISHVSAGLNFIIYQSLYGIGLASSSFFLDYDGYTDSKIKSIKTDITAYIINENLLSNISEDLQESTNNFIKSIDTWNKNRQSEIKKFRTKAKS